MRWVKLVASSGEPAAAQAADDDIFTAWSSACAGCSAREERLEVVGVCRPQEVRCVRIFQCNPEQDAAFGCPAGAGRATAVELYVGDEVVYTWRSMTSWPTLRAEALDVPGRRRRASFFTFSEAPPARLEHTTYCLGNPPTWQCSTGPPR